MAGVDITTIGIEMDTTSVKAGTADLNKAAIAGQKMADSLDKSADKVVKAGAKQEQSYKDVAREAAAAARKQEQEAERAAKKIQQEAERAARAAQNQSRGVMQNLGYQAQDAIVQLQMGASAATVFSQQGSQLASAWNPMLGLFVAVAGIVGGALFNAFGDATNSTEDLAEKIKELNKEFKTLTEEQKIYLSGIETKKQEDLAQAMIKQREEVERLTRKYEDAQARMNAPQGQIQAMGVGTQLSVTDKDLLQYQRDLEAARALLSTTNQEVAESEKNLARINGEAVEGDKIQLTTAQELIKSLEDEKAALQLSGDAMADYVAKKAQATGQDYERIKALYLEIEALQEKEKQERSAQQEAEKALRMEEQRKESIDRAIANLEKQNELYASSNDVQSKYADVLYQIESGLIKVTDAEKARYLAAATANDQLAANARLADSIDAFSKKTEQDRQELDSLIESVDNFGGAWSRTGSIITDTFGNIGDALTDYVARIEGIADKEAKLAEQKKKFFGDPKELDKIAVAEKKLASERTSANLKSFGAIAGAASEMFDEQSKARKTLHGIEVAFNAIEMAMTIQRSLLAAKEAVVTQGKGDPYTAFARMAAMAAVVGALGYAVGGIGGGGGQSAADIQQSQGTGSVLGSNDKSESISKAFDQYLDVGIESLGELRKIREGLTGLSGGIDKLSIGVAVSGLTETKYVNFANQYVGDIIDRGGLKTFGSRSQDVAGREMLAPLQGQISSIFGFIQDSINAATGALEVAQNNPAWAFISDIGKVSFEGLSGEEIQQELNAIFSQQADLITEFVVPAMKEYQQMGEGLFETLTRVAAEMATFNYYTDALGLSFSATGLSAIAVQQNIAELSGGMDKLTENMQTYYEEFFSEEERAAKQMELLSAEMKNLGYDIVPTSREGFRNLVEAIDITTEAGQKQFAGLMSLSEVFADLIPETESLVELQRSASDIAQERASLERQLLQVQGDTAALRALDLAALDSSNQALQQQIWALQDQAAATREAETAARALEQAQKAISTERYNLETQLLQAQGDTAALRARELEKLDESNRAIMLQIWALEDQKAAAELAAQVQADASRAQQEALEDARRAADEQRKLAQGVHDSISDALRSLMGESEAFNQMSMAQARSTLQGALTVAKGGGSLVGYAGLEDALAAVQKIDASRYSSAFEYNQARGQNIGLLSELEKYTRVDGSHANGLDYVPFDGYVAQLHKGEKVMTAAESKSQGALLDEIRALRDTIRAGDSATNNKLVNLLRLVEKWDGDGLPLERVV